MSWNPQRHPLNGRVVVVGGQCSKVGKTALVVDLIRTFAGLSWTAVKMTPHASLGCPVNGAKCNCRADEHTFAIRDERNGSGAGDTARYVAAGAKRAIWVETKQSRVPDALIPLVVEVGRADPLVIEGNAVVQFWRPDLFLMVLDPSNSDFAQSARRALPFADAFVFRSPPREAEKASRTQRLYAEKPIFVQLFGESLPQGVQSLARQLFGRSCHPLEL